MSDSRPSQIFWTGPAEQAQDAFNGEPITAWGSGNAAGGNFHPRYTGYTAIKDAIFAQLKIDGRPKQKPQLPLLPQLLLRRLQAVAISTMGPNVSVRMGVRRMLTRIIIAVCISSHMGTISAGANKGRNSAKIVGQWDLGIRG